MYNFRWEQRHRNSKTLKKRLSDEIKRHDLPAIKKFKLSVSYNGRYDVDNTAATIKAFVDSLRDLKILPDDTKHHFIGYSVVYDETMKKPSYEFKLLVYE